MTTFVALAWSQIGVLSVSVVEQLELLTSQLLSINEQYLMLACTI
jgi:hypothetical protein